VITATNAVLITPDLGTPSALVLTNATGLVNAGVAAAAAIDFSKLAALTDGNILVGNDSNVAVSVNPSGDVDISNSGVFSISSGVIVNADVNTSAAIAYSKLAALTAASFLVGNGSNVATVVSMSGDATLANTGAVTVATTHSGSAHHTKYTDAEAVAAVEAETTLEFDAATAISTAADGLTLSPAGNLELNPGGGNVTLEDGVKIRMGSSTDIIFAHKTAATTADSTTPTLIEGSPNHQGAAADSFFLSNITNDGDMMFLVSDGGNSKEFLLANADIADLQIGHGMATVTLKTASGILKISPGDKTIFNKLTIIEDDTRFAFGKFGEHSLLHSNDAVAANTAISNITKGTPIHQGLTSNSFVFSTVKDDSDHMFLISDGGTSKEYLRADGDVATVDLGHGMLITKFLAASTTLIEGNGTGLGFFATTPAAQPTGVAVTAAGIHAALVTLGLITA